MAQDKLNILITAEDKASGVLGKVGGGFKKLGKVIAASVVTGAAVAGAAALGFGIKAVQAAGDAEEMVAKFEVTFGEAAAGMEASLGAFAQATGRSRFELMGMGADMGAVLKGMGLGETVAAGMSDEMLKLAVDVGSFNNVSSPEVAHRFTTALSGEFESLKALGIVINQTRLKQELLNMGIKDNVNEVDQATKAQAIMNLIQQSTTDAQGDAERTSGSYTNQMVALKATIKDVTTEIGLKLLPVITPLISKMGELALKVAPVLGDIFENVLIPAFSGFLNLVNGLGSGDFSLGNLIPPEMMATIQPVVDAVGKLFAAFQESLPAIQAAASSFVEFLKTQFAIVGPVIMENLGGAIENIAAFWSEHGATIIQVVKTIFTIIVATITGAVMLITGIFNALTALLTGNWAGAWEAIKATIVGFVEGALNVVGVSLDGFIATWSGIWENAKLIVESIWTGITEGVKTAIAGLISSVIGGLSEMWQKAKDFLGIGSPSKLFAEMGSQIMGGIGAGIGAGTPQAVGPIKPAVLAAGVGAMGSGGAGIGAGMNGKTGGQISIANLQVNTREDEEQLINLLKRV